MRLGFELPVARAWASPPNEQQIVARAVELGSGSLWCFPRLLVLVQPRDTSAGRLDPARVQEPHPAMVIGGDGAAAIDPTVARGGGFVGGNVDVDAVIEQGWTVRQDFEPQHTGRW